MRRLERFNAADSSSSINADLQWTAVDGTFGITGNKGYFVSAGGGIGIAGICRANYDFTTDDQTCECTVTTNSTNSIYSQVGVAVRMNSSNSACYAATIVNNDQLQILYIDSGGLVQSILASLTYPHSTRYTIKLKLKAVGNRLRLYINDCKFPVLDITDNNITSGKRCGIVAGQFGTGDLYEDWEAYDTQIPYIVGQDKFTIGPTYGVNNGNTGIFISYNNLSGIKENDLLIMSIHCHMNSSYISFSKAALSLYNEIPVQRFIPKEWTFCKMYMLNESVGGDYLYRCTDYFFKRAKKNNLENYLSLNYIGSGAVCHIVNIRNYSNDYSNLQISGILENSIYQYHTAVGPVRTGENSTEFISGQYHTASIHNTSKQYGLGINFFYENHPSGENKLLNIPSGQNLNILYNSFTGSLLNNGNGHKDLSTAIVFKDITSGSFSGYTGTYTPASGGSDYGALSVTVKYLFGETIFIPGPEDIDGFNNIGTLENAAVTLSGGSIRFDKRGGLYI